MNREHNQCSQRRMSDRVRGQGGAYKRENYARTHFISLLLYVSCGE